MIFEMVDGRTHFYQWDTNRKIKVNDPTIKEVHFCNRTDTCSLVVEVVDGYVSVPNILLQNGYNFRAFAYDGEATLQDEIFEVKARTKPSNYVYTETEIKRYEDLKEELLMELDSRLEEIAESGIKVDLDGYYTKGETDELVQSNAEVFFSILTNHNHDDRYVGVEHVHPEYITKEYVDEAIKNVDVDVNLEDYATKEYVGNANDSTLGLVIGLLKSDYVSDIELYQKDYATNTALKNQLNNKADKQHTHSAADIEGLQVALNSKATQEDIDKAIELHDHRYDYAPIEHSHGDSYAAKSHTHSYNNLLDKPTIPSIEGLATEAYVRAAIANIDIPSVEGLASEEYVNEAINNIEIPSIEGLATEQYVDEKVGNTKVDLTGYATEEFVNEAISNIEIPEDTEVIELAILSGNAYKALTNEVATKVAANPDKYIFKVTHANSSINNVYYTFSRLEDQSSFGYVNIYYSAVAETGLATSPEIKVSTLRLAIDYQNDNTTVKSGAATLTTVNISSTSGGSGESVDLSNYYTKSEINEKIPSTVSQLPNDAGYVTEETLNEFSIEVYDNFNNFYTKEETDTAIQTALNAIGVAEGGAY